MFALCLYLPAKYATRLAACVSPSFSSKPATELSVVATSRCFGTLTLGSANRHKHLIQRLGPMLGSYRKQQEEFSTV